MTFLERAQEALTDADLAAHLIFHKGHGKLVKTTHFKALKTLKEN